MAYSKQTWDTSSYVNPTRMNHIEDGVKEASDRLSAVEPNSLYSSGSHFTSGWIILPIFINASSNAADCYIVLPKPIKDGVSVSVSGTIRNIRVDGSEITSGASISGVSINNRPSGIVLLSISFSGLNKAFHTGSITIANLDISFN